MADSVEQCVLHWQFKRPRPQGFRHGESRDECRGSIINGIVESITGFQKDQKKKMLEAARARCAQIAFQKMKDALAP